jgi:hypothetical protein
MSMTPLPPAWIVIACTRFTCHHFKTRVVGSGSDASSQGGGLVRGVGIEDCGQAWRKSLCLTCATRLRCVT